MDPNEFGRFAPNFNSEPNSQILDKEGNTVRVINSLSFI